MSKTPIVIIGALGRMGRAIIDLASTDTSFVVSGACVRLGSKSQAPDEWPVSVDQDIFSCLKKLGDKKSVLMDFSHHSSLEQNLCAALEYGVPMVIGTTGHEQPMMDKLKDAAQKIPLLFAPNTSLMANLMMHLAKISANALGKKAQVKIVDVHHKHKQDAPSGTAIALKNAVKSAKDSPPVEVFSMRAGSVAGEHTLHFFMENERLELCHKVAQRQVFAEGALFAAQFLFKQGPGLYDMNDVLNLKLTIH